MDKQFLQVQVSEGVSRLEILEGVALNPQPPRKIELIGKIDAPVSWWNIKKDKIDKDSCHVVVTDKDITLHLNETSFYEHGYVSGKLRIDQECAQWGINEDQMYSSKDLARLMKANEYLFPNRQQWVDVVAALMRFEANIQVNLKDIKETSGDYAKSVEVTVNKQVPNSFNLSTKVLGKTKREYTVELGAEFSNQQVRFYLDSSQLAYIISEQSDKLIESNTKEFIDAGIAVIYT